MNNLASSQMIGPEHVIYIRYNVKQLSRIITWLREMSDSGDKWCIDMWNVPCEIYSVKFKNTKHKILFELRFAGEIDVVNFEDVPEWRLQNVNTTATGSLGYYNHHATNASNP